MSHRGFREGVVVTLAAAALSVLLTYPLAFEIGSVGRVGTGDGQYSIWNVAWVARTLVVSPSRVFDANIFYPHRGTLTYSEANLVPGALAIPGYWLTRNPFVAHNSVVLLAFMLSAIGAYLLVRRLTGHRPAAAVAAVLYASCPFVMARMPHIQLLMTAGLPFALLALHAFVERVSLTTSVALGGVLVLQALACGYYGIFAGLIVAGGILWFAAADGRWRRPRYWLLSALAAVLSVGTVFPFLQPYLALNAGDAPFRSLEESRQWSADGLAYLTAGGWGDRWMMDTFGKGNEVLFPGFVTLALAGVAVWLTVAALRRRWQGLRPAEPAPGAAAPVRLRIVLFYVLVAGVALWLSFGPAGGLYALLYRWVPVFALLRAPARIGIVVTLALTVLAGLALASLLGNRRHASLFAALVGLLAVCELAQVPLYFAEAPREAAAYRMLAQLPRGPVAEFPFFWERADFHRHAFYMLNSTWHWQPLINGYSDYIPPDFRKIVGPLSTFPSKQGFDALRDRHALYVVFHLDFYDRPSRKRLLAGLDRYRDYLRPLVRNDNVWLYEIVAFPR